MTELGGEVLLQPFRHCLDRVAPGPVGSWGRGVMGSKQDPFKGRQFTAEALLWAACWYLLTAGSQRVDETKVNATTLPRPFARSDAFVQFRPSNAEGLRPPSRVC